jgi:CIC family chloride channel protein
VRPGFLSVGLLLLIAVSKIVTASVTHGGGGSVGSFMPSMVVGGTIGAGFGLLLSTVWTASAVSPGAYALVGMAAMLTVVVRAPLTAILLVFELTGSYGMVLPLALTSIIATVIADRIHPGSTYISALRRKGIHLPQHEDRDVLDTVLVRDVMAWVPTINATATIDELDRMLTETGHHGVPVVSDNGAMVGIVTVTDMEAIALLEDTTGIPVSTIMTKQPISASPTMPVSAALARMASLGLGRLPVVDANGKLIGMFRRESVVRAYHHALTRSTSNALYRARVNLRGNRQADFFEILVRDESPVAGHAVKEVAWPPEATLVSIRRYQSVLIPHGDTKIQVGDELTIFCEAANRASVRDVVSPPVSDDSAD